MKLRAPIPLLRSLVYCSTALAASTTARAQTINTDDLGAQTERRPKWEAGVAGVALTNADYPASDEYSFFAIPAPYFVYHGKTLRSDDEGSRLRQELTPNAELSVSGGGSLRSDSSHSDTRQGMPDLGYLAEIGPSVRLIYDGPQPRSKIFLDLPLRAVVSFDSSALNWRGVVFEPELSYQTPRYLRGRLTVRASLSSEFTSAALQHYYYDVQPQYATPQRPAYSAHGNYLGSTAGLSINYAVTRSVRLFTALSYNNHTHAANDDSPLFRSPSDYSVLVGFSWSLFRSHAFAED